MFESSPEFQQHGVEPDQPRQERQSIPAILLESVLPKDVKTAKINYSHERFIDACELKRLTDPSMHKQENEERLSARKIALTPYLGSFLTCILIRLPGVAYTLEIDTEKGSIVHWEWQQS